MALNGWKYRKKEMYRGEGQSSTQRRKILSLLLVTAVTRPKKQEPTEKKRLIFIIMTIKVYKQITLLVLALSAFVFAQTRLIEQVSDSLDIPKVFENYNNFQVEKWGPITYSGDGKCDILDLYQKNVLQGLGYSTIVDVHYKQTKNDSLYTCESWGLGLSFKVTPDTNKYSENFALSPNTRTNFSAQSKDQIRKLFESDSAFFEIKSVTPVSYQTLGKCHKVDFLFNMANEQSGFHGIIDMKATEAVTGTDTVCAFWGLAVKYKLREVVEKVITKKRIIEVVKVPPPKPDTVFVPTPVSTPVPAKPATGNNCMHCCCCCDH